ncbi:MAG: hypothetical protein U0234_20095 [Sandaracinus sp.]
MKHHIAISLVLLITLELVGCPAPRRGCSFNSDCTAGHFCQAGACIAGCTTDAQCVATNGAGSTCNTFGICSGGTDAGTPRDGGPDGATADAGRDAAMPTLDAFMTMDAFVTPDAFVGADGGLDAGSDAGSDGGSDAGTDSGRDAGTDAGADAGSDAAVTPPRGSVYFSEYIEGTSNNKALEVYNGTGADLDMSTCTIREYINGSSTAGAMLALSGTLIAGDVLTICNSNASTIPMSSCDVRAGGVMQFNGNDALELVCGGVTLDVIGQIGMDPMPEWGAGLTSTQDNTLRRRCSVTSGDPIGTDAFDPASEWDGFPTDTFDGLGARGCP